MRRPRGRFERMRYWDFTAIPAAMLAAAGAFILGQQLTDVSRVVTAGLMFATFAILTFSAGRLFFGVRGWRAEQRNIDLRVAAMEYIYLPERSDYFIADVLKVELEEGVGPWRWTNGMPCNHPEPIGFVVNGHSWWVCLDCGGVSPVAFAEKERP